MSHIRDLLDEFNTISSSRLEWQKYWADVAKYVLPHTAQFDRLFSNGTSNAAPINAVVDTPVAAERSKHLYDMTSLWGIERLTAGILTLKTPESDRWHDLGVDTEFDHQTSAEEKTGLERVRDYQFKVRSNPKSGFWSNHKSAVRSMCAFGDGWMLVEENHGQRLPYRYEHVPLFDCYPMLSSTGQPSTMYRSKLLSAYNIRATYGEKAGSKITDMANDPRRMHERVQVLQGVRPRSDKQRTPIGVNSGAFASTHFLPQEEIILSEGGYYEFPFVRYAWNNSGTCAYSEGPVAIALGEIKSLQEMAKNELIGTQMLLRPPIATIGKNMGRINFNPGANNPGLINGDGNPLFAPMNAGIRPDFARVVIDARRNGLRELLYLNLWQVLLDKEGMTATEAMIRAQEKGELLGPVGISLNEGLSGMVDREVGILGRKGAFNPGSALELPASLGGRDVAPHFTSPLDRLRRIGELIGIQRLVEFAGMLGQVGLTNALARLDDDEMIEIAQDVLGAPVRVLTPREKAKEKAGPQQQIEQLMATMGAAEGAGNAMRAVGEGGKAVTEASEMAANSPAAQRAMQMISSMGQGA